MHASVNTFKHEYLCNQLADWNEILSEASLGWGKGSVSVDPDWIRTLVSMATDSSDRVIMGKKRAKIEKEKIIRLEHRLTLLNILDYLYCYLLAMECFSYWEHN